MAVFTNYRQLQQVTTVLSGNSKFIFCQLLWIQAKQFVPARTLKVQVPHSQ